MSNSSNTSSDDHKNMSGSFRSSLEKMADGHIIEALELSLDEIQFSSNKDRLPQLLDQHSYITIHAQLFTIINRISQSQDPSLILSLLQHFQRCLDYLDAPTGQYYDLYESMFRDFLQEFPEYVCDFYASSYPEQNGVLRYALIWVIDGIQDKSGPTPQELVNHLIKGLLGLHSLPRAYCHDFRPMAGDWDNSSQVSIYQVIGQLQILLDDICTALRSQGIELDSLDVVIPAWFEFKSDN